MRRVQAHAQHRGRHVILLARKRALLAVRVLHDQVIRPLQTLTNVISSLREEDFSFRARGAVQNDALGELALEVNALADTLSEQKTFAVEATELLKRVLEEIDIPLFTFDPNGNLIELIELLPGQRHSKANEALLAKDAHALAHVIRRSCQMRN